MAASVRTHLRWALQVSKKQRFQSILPSSSHDFTPANRYSINRLHVEKRSLCTLVNRSETTGQTLNLVGRPWKPCSFFSGSGRGLATDNGGLDPAAVKSRIDDIADKFVEARELLEDARDVKGTVYFSEDMKEAAAAVDETLKDYADFLAELNENQKQEVLRTIGLKMEELKAQKNMLTEEMLEDE